MDDWEKYQKFNWVFSAKTGEYEIVLCYKIFSSYSHLHLAQGIVNTHWNRVIESRSQLKRAHPTDFSNEKTGGVPKLNEHIYLLIKSEW